MIVLSSLCSYLVHMNIVSCFMRYCPVNVTDQKNPSIHLCRKWANSCIITENKHHLCQINFLIYWKSFFSESTVWPAMYHYTTKISSAPFVFVQFFRYFWYNICCMLCHITIPITFEQLKNCICWQYNILRVGTLCYSPGNITLGTFQHRHDYIQVL